MVTMLASVVALTPVLTKDNEPAQRLDAAVAVLAEILDPPNQSLPLELLEKAYCVVIVPDLKTAAFVVGAKYGPGYLSCRRDGLTGWSAPGTVEIEGGSLGFQIGGSSTDLVMLMMTDILSWSRSQGLFAGVALEGAILQQDLDGNDRLYGKKLSNRDVVTRNVRPPRSAAALVALLNRFSLVETSSASRKQETE